MRKLSLLFYILLLFPSITISSPTDDMSAAIRLIGQHARLLKNTDKLQYNEIMKQASIGGNLEAVRKLYFTLLSRLVPDREPPKTMYLKFYQRLFAVGGTNLETIEKHLCSISVILDGQSLDQSFKELSTRESKALEELLNSELRLIHTQGLRINLKQMC